MIVKINNKNKKSAFISIFAVFFSAIVVSILTGLYILLIKQLAIMNLDASSFQSIYMADSAFECALYKEQTASGTTSIFLPANSTNLGFCSQAGDAVWASSPVTTSGKANSIINVSMDTQQGKFCGVVTTSLQVNNTASSSFMSISGQNRECTDTITKVVERLIEFSY